MQHKMQHEIHPIKQKSAGIVVPALLYAHCAYFPPPRGRPRRSLQSGRSRPARRQAAQSPFEGYPAVAARVRVPAAHQRDACRAAFYVKIILPPCMKRAARPPNSPAFRRLPEPVRRAGIPQRPPRASGSAQSNRFPNSAHCISATRSISTASPPAKTSLRRASSMRRSAPVRVMYSPPGLLPSGTK